MDWVLWYLASEHLGDLGDYHVIGLRGTHIGLRMAWGTLKIQGWKANLEAGPTSAFGTRKPGDLLIGFQRRCEKPPSPKAGKGGKDASRWTENLELLSWVGSENR